MRFYELDTRFSFGTYEGKTLKEVLSIQPSYIDWCVRYLDHFYISPDVLKEILFFKPGFFLTKDAINKLDIKFAKLQIEFNDDESDNNEVYLDYDEIAFDELSGGSFGDYEAYKSSSSNFGDLRDYLGL